MTIQEIFYLVATIFMITAMAMAVIVSIVLIDIAARISNLLTKIQNFTDEAFEGGRRVIDQAEEAIPKIIRAISLSEVIKMVLREWREFKKSKK